MEGLVFVKLLNSSTNSKILYFNSLQKINFFLTAWTNLSIKQTKDVIFERSASVSTVASNMCALSCIDCSRFD